MRFCFHFAVLMLASIIPSSSFAQERNKAEIAKQVKAATALVEVTKTQHGSAFCIHESGYFLTNQHVVGDAAEVKLILHPGLKNQQVFTAKIMRVDKGRDLALLKVEEKATLTALPLGSCDGIGELTEVIAAGFPFGKSLTLDENEYPAVSVNVGRVTALRTKQSELERIQMDAVLNPGNSGGPVVDTNGKVVGMVVSGVRGTTLNFAIPVTHVERFVDTVEVEVVSPAVAHADRYKPVEFRVRTVSLIPGKSDSYDVELRLGGKDHFRSYAMKYEKSAYRTITPMLRSPSKLRLTITYEDGRIEGVVEDRAFKMGDKIVKLSEVRTLRFARVPSAVLADARTVLGVTSGLEDLSVATGAGKLAVDAGKAIELSVEPPANETKVEYTVIVRRDNKELARVENLFGFKGAPGGADWSEVAKKLEGLWLLDRDDANGGTWSITEDQGIHIENQKVVWVNESGKMLADSPRGRIKIDPSKSPMTMDIVFQNSTWMAIFKIEGDCLTIATHCNDKRRPAQFTTQLSAGAERATFVRVYKLKPKSEGN